jgi:fructuronate reductase
MNRLHPSTVASLPADVARPAYDRQALRGGIVHLGIGAFPRAHLAAATEAALHSSGDLRWGIVGVSLRRADTRDALAPQQGLYTLALRDAGDDGAPRETLQVVGALIKVLVAPEDPQAVLEQIAHADTRIVSLSVTEKGYHRDPASGALRLDDPDVIHDLAHPEAPQSTLGFVVHGLHRRMRRGQRAITLLSCDNLPTNGNTLRDLVLALAEHVDAALHAWILASCTFPNSMVDRIVPRTTGADRTRISRRLGVEDAWPVVAEPYFEWALEDRFACGRPAWDEGGVRFVEHAEPFDRLKLRMVNGSHSALAYLGALAGLRSVDRTVAAPALRGFVDSMLRDEVEPTLTGLRGLDLASYRSALLARLANPALQHQTHQIAMDGSQKLPQRLLDTVRDRLRADASLSRLAFAVAAWMHYLRGVDETGQRHAIEDPLAPALAAQLKLADQAAAGITDSEAAERQRVETFCGFTPVFGELGANARFVHAVTRSSLSLRERGVMHSLENWRA